MIDMTFTWAKLKKRLNLPPLFLILILKRNNGRAREMAMAGAGNGMAGWMHSIEEKKEQITEYCELGRI